MPEDVKLAWDRIKANPTLNVWNVIPMTPDELLVKHWVQTRAGEYIKYDI